MAKAKVVKQAQPADAIDVFLAQLNKDMKGVGRVDRGRDISWLDPERMRTGILGLDVVSRGGLPRGGLVQFWGPFSCGKTTTALHCMAAEQKVGEDTLFAAAEGFNKDWARKNGLWIPYAEEEREGQTADALAQMDAYDAYGVQEGYGTVAVIQHVHGDGLLEAVARAVKTNLFSIVVVDSLAVLRNTRQIEEAQIGDEDMGGGGQINMFNRFIGRCFSALNTKYNANNEIDMYGEFSNQTCVLCLNQARQKLAGGGKRPGQVLYQPPGGEGLKHCWHLSVEFRKGEELGEKEGLDGRNNWTPWGVEIRIRSNKSKIGPSGRSAAWELYTEDHEAFSAGAVDVAKEIRVWGVYYDIIHVQGAWYSLPDGQRVNGKDEVDRALANEPELRQNIADAVIEACKR